MYAGSIRGANVIMLPPAAQEKSVLPLRALKTDIDGTPVVVSAWIPTPDELHRLNQGCAVWLYVQGNTMPPVSLTVAPEDE